MQTSFYRILRTITRSSFGRRLALLSVLFLSAATPCLSQQQASASETSRTKECLQMAKDQRAREVCAGNDLRSADEELNAIYRKLLAKYRRQPAVVKALKSAHLKWINYSKAVVDSYFPDVPDLRSIWGSQMSECESMLKTELTVERTRWLRDMLGEEPFPSPGGPPKLCPFPF